MEKEELARKFSTRFPGIPRIFKAPGRVNLIGEHTDYNDGFVLPMAIDRYSYIALVKRADLAINVWSENYQQEYSTTLDGDLQKQNHWSDYVIGVIWALMDAGISVRGMDIFVDSEVPVGSGLSSSAALEVSVAFAVMSVHQEEIDKKTLALVCQKAENDFVGMKCGIMDQFIACFGQSDHALFLDCRSLESELVPLPSDSVSVAVCNTMVKHELGASEYNKRRAECEEGVAMMKRELPGILALRDVSSKAFRSLESGLSMNVRKRCRHVIYENERVQKSVELLKRGDAAAFGELMNASHASLRDDYEVSCRELDDMVEIAKLLPTVLGARMTGGGFGGCTVNLTKKGSEQAFVDEVYARYLDLTGIAAEIYLCTPSSGVTEI